MHGRLRRYRWLRERKFGNAEIKFFAYLTTGNRLRGLGPELELEYVDWFVGQTRDQNEEHLLIELVDVDPDSSVELQKVGHVKIGDLFYKIAGAPKQPINVTFEANQDWIIVVESQGTAKVA